jgi:hypothetical protein
MPVPPTPPIPPVPPKPPVKFEKPKDNGKKSMNVVWVLVGLVILAGLWYLLSGKRAEAPAPGEEAAAREEGSASEQAMREDTPNFLWEFFPAGGDNDTGAPKTRITLTANGETKEVGTFDGSCLVINGSSWALAQNELTGVICWFGGAGDEVGIFYENSQYVVKQGVIEEGVEGESGLRGNYKTLFTL